MPTVPDVRTTLPRPQSQASPGRRLFH